MDSPQNDLESGVHDRIAQMARDMHGSRDHQLTAEQVLQDVTEASVELLPSVAHAGITLIKKPGPGREAILESVLASGPIPAQADALQHEYGEGPGLDTIWEHYTVRINNVETEQRWPKLMPALYEQTPIRSVLSLQLYTKGHELGALTLYAEVADAFDADTEDLAVDLATHAAIALGAARKGNQFRSALASRDIIGQAKGIIMERYNLHAVEAFALLRKLSQDANIRVADVAARLVEQDHPLPFGVTE